jgi:DNA-binding NarL/FixJ family response regulator
MEQTQTNILIADDHPAVRMGIVSLLKHKPNLKVIGQVGNSNEISKYLTSIKTDLLILDLNMPGQDYSVMIPYIHQNFPDVKVMVFSGYYDTDLEKRLKKLGVDGFVTKNIHPSRVLDFIIEVVDGNKCFISDEMAEKANLEKQVSDRFKDNFCKRLGISKREQEILTLISKGMTSQTIGKALFISKYTVETHRKNILRKLDMNSSTELVKFAIKQGLV